MNTDPTQDAHSLGIALRLAHAQNRELRKQLSTATEALEYVLNKLQSHHRTRAGITTIIKKAKQALAAINPADVG